MSLNSILLNVLIRKFFFNFSCSFVIVKDNTSRYIKILYHLYKQFYFQPLTTNLLNRGKPLHIPVNGDVISLISDTKYIYFLNYVGIKTSLEIRCSNGTVTNHQFFIMAFTGIFPTYIHTIICY